MVRHILPRARYGLWPHAAYRCEVTHAPQDRPKTHAASHRRGRRSAHAPYGAAARLCPYDGPYPVAPCVRGPATPFAAPPAATLYGPPAGWAALSGKSGLGYGAGPRPQYNMPGPRRPVDRAT